MSSYRISFASCSPVLKQMLISGETIPSKSANRTALAVGIISLLVLGSGLVLMFAGEFDAIALILIGIGSMGSVVCLGFLYDSVRASKQLALAKQSSETLQPAPLNPSEKQTKGRSSSFSNKENESTSTSAAQSPNSPHESISPSGSHTLSQSDLSKPSSSEENISRESGIEFLSAITDALHPTSGVPYVEVELQPPTSHSYIHRIGKLSVLSENNIGINHIFWENAFVFTQHQKGCILEVVKISPPEGNVIAHVFAGTIGELEDRTLVFQFTLSDATTEHQP